MTRTVIQWRKPGWRPPRWLTRRLEKTHPTVSLVWIKGPNRWGLVERVGNSHQMIALIGDETGEYERPTVDNTIGFLNRHRTSAIYNKWRLDEWLDERLDAPEREQNREVDERASERIAEGAERHAHLVIPKVSIAKAW